MLSENLRGKADDLHEVALAQLARNRTEDAGASRVVGLGEQHRGILIEADERAVGTAIFLGDADDDSLHDLAFLDLAAGLRRLDGGSDDVAHRRVLAIVASGHADAQELLGSRVVRVLEACLLLDHSVTSPSPRFRARA